MVAYVYPRRTTSTATTVTVTQPAGNTVIAQLAAGMSPNSWASLSAASGGTVSGQTVALGGGTGAGGSGGGSGSAIVFVNSMPWNAFDSTINICAEDHGVTPQGTVKWMVYNPATNAWTIAARITANPHGYQHLACNPYTGDLYFRRYSGGVIANNVYKHSYGDADPTNWPLQSFGSPLHNAGVAQSAVWWTGAFTGGAGIGAQGAMVWYVTTDNQALNAIDFYNPLTNTWFYSKTSGVSPGAASSNNRTVYQGVCAYSAVKNCMVYGGGNNDQGVSYPRNLWKFDSAGNVTTVANVPAEFSLNAGETGTRVVADPVSGNFLFYANAHMWELNPDTGVWTQKQSPPAYGSPLFGPGNTHLDQNSRAIMVELPEYGVVAVITQNARTDASGSFWLYRNA